ncbi:MAG TPA: protein kinase, partial [Kofleriaceae bacterium]
MEGCPPDETIARLIDGELSAEARADLHAHIDGCEACRSLVADAARGDDRDAVLPAGASFGRYLVIELLGSGAMGIVYGAWDAQLQRRVALKLMRPEQDGALLVREAQAMARLAHPNVVAVHDTGAIDGREFVAMELVEGETLGAWLEQPRTWREIIAVFVQVGEGLAAAHAVGLVHRDFKPDNAFVGADRRARVGDFGLAHGGRLPAGGEGVRMTRTGALVGTPAFMAPEQLAGEPADARSDQFAFCVALYEALCGARPFEGDDVEQLRAAIGRGVGSERSTRSGAGEGGDGARRPTPRVPSRVRRVVVRGLAADPARRYPDMRALLAALDRTLRGPRIAIAATIGVAAIALAAAFVLRAPEAPCAGDAWSPAWNEADRAAVLAGFTRSGRTGAAATFAQIDSSLGAYATTWSVTRRRVCEATHVAHTQSEPLLAARMQCLDDRRREVISVARVLVEADAPLVDNAAKLVAGLAPPDGCATLRTEASDPTGDPARRVQLAALRGQLAEAKELDDAGLYARGLAVARGALIQAKQLGAPALVAALMYRRGHLEKQASLPNAEATMQEAAQLAIAARDDATAADAWTYLAFLAGFDGGRHAEGERYAAYAGAELQRLGGDDLREARLLDYHAGLLFTDEARTAEARALLTRAHELFVRAGAPELLVLDNDQAQASLALERGQLAE